MIYLIIYFVKQAESHVCHSLYVIYFLHVKMLRGLRFPRDLLIT